MVWQNVDPVAPSWNLLDPVYTVHPEETKKRPGHGHASQLISHLVWIDPRRDWELISPWRGRSSQEVAFRMLNAIDYQGAIPVEKDAAGMDRIFGAPDALGFVTLFSFDRLNATFDTAYST